MFEDTSMILCSLLLELPLILIVFCFVLFCFFLHSPCVQFQACRWFYVLYYLFGKFLKKSGLSAVEFFSVI